MTEITELEQEQVEEILAEYGQAIRMAVLSEVAEAIERHYGKGAELLRRYRLGIAYDEDGFEVKQEPLPDHLCSGDMIAALGCAKEIFAAIKADLTQQKAET